MQAEMNFQKPTAGQFETRLAAWLERAQKVIDDYRAKSGYDALPRPVLGLDPGKRYIRVVRTEERDGKIISRSVHCFIDTTNGDVLKPASWKGPAKHARGNIFTGKDGVGPHGANYL